MIRGHFHLPLLSIERNVLFSAPDEVQANDMSKIWGLGGVMKQDRFS